MASLTRVSPLERSSLRAPLRIVSIGGGTGLSTLLSGIKKHARGARQLPLAGAPEVDITAVVTVSDDGGSSGRLRRDFDILPPGDIRNCMTALSEDEDLLSQLFQHRFAAGRGLKGHSFGNLFLTAMHQITGDFAHAVKLSSEILATRGRIFPATSANASLEAILEDGSVIRGETQISKSRGAIKLVRLRPENCEPLPETLEAISAADLITIGPGSLYTSIVPNLLVKQIPEAIQRSPAIKACFVNLMWQPGETVNYSASRHVQVIHEHARCNLIDIAVVNTAPIPEQLTRRYARAHVRPVEIDLDALNDIGVKVVTAELVCDAGMQAKKIRHNPDALASVVIDLASRSRAHQVRAAALLSQRTRTK
ncbi:MAG: uridine diphosphate-N-acetylglucosamine-binding protein YvcK [Acidobacteriaceae bacterium]|nr:uridine diphosphate-N-acetylglucosamine-binding protein YvcK [Acidobacteriaceae bacterium]MBV8569048.1 uridine diphosphate-N-acetylglucosamine-binding protein YvcK [Acidobacteriaceae bacterium]